MKRAALSLMLSFAVAGSLYAAQAPVPAVAAGCRSGGAGSGPAGALGRAQTDKAADITAHGVS